MTEETMPKLIRLYITHSLIGFLLSAVFVGLLLVFDVAGLRGLILRSAAGWLALLMLWVFNGIIFAGVQTSIRVMLMAERSASPPGGKRQRTQSSGKGAVGVAVPAKGRASDQRHQRHAAAR
ncbi:hypothetical protein N6L24_15360 [Cognatishimia sp. SS12]|uniref:hypothetical protein n=1 Tax=Cognatishimia sp. SS12 TaxID=2979465 RepID=UPI00232B47FF|nr:hypothetical protein [Cognatishimia sp. SS12]MDC0739666.1 hypothetical protein [Cognatishimia sp. SS12]